MKAPAISSEANLRLKFYGLTEADKYCLVDMYIDASYDTLLVAINGGDTRNEDFICDIISIVYKNGHTWSEFPLTDLTEWDVAAISRNGLMLYAEQRIEEENEREYFD